MPETTLDVRHLQTHFFTRDGVAKAVEDISFSLGSGEVLGLVGESGSGKTVTGFSILGLVDAPGKVVGGEILFKGRDLLKLSEEEMRKVRGNQLAMVFQDPMMRLNPVLRIDTQMMEAIQAHQNLGKVAARELARDALGKVGIASPDERLRAYPHQFSGGMRQRIMIAMALITKPELLIADEPTTALDVTVQAQILELIRKMQNELGMAVILITHDLGVISGFCDRVSVMYAGSVVESGTADDIFYRAHHAYTRGLKKSIPSTQEKGSKLYTIPGAPPQPIGPKLACAFSPRSDLSFTEKEARMQAQFLEVEPGHWVEVHPASVENYKEYLK